MTRNSVVRARIDEATKNEAAAVLAAMGLSLSDAFTNRFKRDYRREESGLLGEKLDALLMEVVDLLAADAALPRRLQGDCLMASQSRFLLDVLEFRPHAVASGCPVQQEAALARLAADEREAQKEGFRCPAGMLPDGPGRAEPRAEAQALARSPGHVSLSIPGAALRRNVRNAVRSRSASTGWRSAVNRSFFLDRAACRTRASAWVALSRFCARRVLCRPAFPLVPTLRSTRSATGRPALFAGFIAAAL